MHAVTSFVRGVSAAALIALLSACTSIPVSSDVNTALIHSVQCHTFAWAGSFRGGPLSATYANPVNEARLRTAIETHLQSVGLHQVPSGADCLVGYGIGVHGVLEDWNWGWGMGPWWGSPVWGAPYVYPEAIVAVDLYDAHSNQPLWHAYAREAAAGLQGDRAAQGIDAAVAAIFTKYPG
jgi:hypothetical protein